MDAALVSKITHFVAQVCSVPVEVVREESTLLGDLGIDSEEKALRFFNAFAREFEVDLRGFDLLRYFPVKLEMNDEYGIFLYWLVTVFRRILPVGTREDREGILPVTVADLCRAAEARSWAVLLPMDERPATQPFCYHCGVEATVTTSRCSQCGGELSFDASDFIPIYEVPSTN